MLQQKIPGLALAAAALGALAMPAAAQTVKIGFIDTYSGPFAQAGDELDKGVKLYIKEHEKDLPPGVKIELVTRDDTGPNPDVAKRVAQELITRDHVQLLAGEIASPNAAAIAPLTAEAKIPFVIMNAAGVNIPRISPYVVRVSFTLWQISLPMGQWAATNGFKKAYVAVSDFIPGHDSEAAFTKAFADAGGKIVGAVRFPPTNPDFAPFVQRAKDAKPDAVFIFVPAGEQGIAFVKAFTERGLQKAGIKLIGPGDVVDDDVSAAAGQFLDGGGDVVCLVIQGRVGAELARALELVRARRRRDHVRAERLRDREARRRDAAAPS